MEIQTSKQSRAAIREIKSKTRWTMARIARECGVGREWLRKLSKGLIANPSIDKMEKIEVLLNRVRKME